MRIYDIDRYEYLAEFEIPKVKVHMDYDYDPNEAYFPITSIRWLNKSTVVFSSGDGTIKLYNVKEVDSKKRHMHTINFHGSGINALDVDCDRRNFFSGGMDHCLRVFDSLTYKEKVTYKGEDKKHSEHFNRIFSVL